MARAMYRHYPQLDKEEFTEVCHHLESKYCQATLGPLRRQWRLHVFMALDFDSDSRSAYTTYVQISRPLDDTQDLGDLGAQIEAISLGGANSDMVTADAKMEDLENSDQEVLKQQHAVQPNLGYVRYEIHFHPTYRAPCLWFSLHDLPTDEPAFDVETVFRRLVPDQFKDILRRSGPIGGISVDHHPVTGVPCFFVHPCLLGDAMAEFDCPKEDYLMTWLGLVGGSVGLWVPKEMAMSG